MRTPQKALLEANHWRQAGPSYSLAGGRCKGSSGYSGKRISPKGGRGVSPNWGAEHPGSLQSCHSLQGQRCLSSSSVQMNNQYEALSPGDTFYHVTCGRSQTWFLSCEAASHSPLSSFLHAQAWLVQRASSTLTQQ